MTQATDKMVEISREDAIRSFFVTRFGRKPESDPAYFAEWVKRINNGTAIIYGDKETIEMLHRFNLA